MVRLKNRGVSTAQSPTRSAVDLNVTEKYIKVNHNHPSLQKKKKRAERLVTLPEKYEVRLRTKNFRRVKSEAVKSIDYEPTEKIIEIEYTTGETYHYRDAKRKEWNKMMEFANKGEGLGGYINEVFKEPYKKQERDSYKVNLIPEDLDA
jgi:hypothetical protein